ncbi:MAG: hypothetical protein JWL72_1556 [Ilumatobacteraceae bacterium]|nr:hypothetical protein [Ilumatobacteraceae bacterium]
MYPSSGREQEPAPGRWDSGGNRPYCRSMRRYPWLMILVGSVLTVSIRLRSFWTPITSDEGGFLAIARAWAHGDTLYRDVWVDRPQGLLAIFRFWDWIAGGSTASLRIMAMLFGVGLVIAVGMATTTLSGRKAGGLAAILVAFAAASPAIEGHIANGELLSGAFAAGGFAVSCVALRRADHARLLVLSGLLAGCALSVKQSGYEGLLAIGVWLIIAVVAHWRTFREAVRAVGWVSAGVLAVLAVLAVHGAITGYSRWWFAFAGYRLDKRSALEGADWARFYMTARIARPTIWPLLGIIAAGGAILLAVRLRRREPPSSPSTPFDGALCLLLLWPLAASVAFLTGGQFHRHYWVTLCGGLCALAGGLITRHLRAAIAVPLALVALVPTYVNTAKILVESDHDFVITASGDDRPNTDEHLAAWFLANRKPGEEMYVMCASASFYADAHEDPPFPYLWQDNVLMVPGALQQLRALLASATRAPKYIAVYETPIACDPSGQLASVVEANYRHMESTSGVGILVRITPS